MVKSLPYGFRKKGIAHVPFPGSRRHFKIAPYLIFGDDKASGIELSLAVKPPEFKAGFQYHIKEF